MALSDSVPPSTPPQNEVDPSNGQKEAQILPAKKSNIKWLYILLVVYAIALVGLLLWAPWKSKNTAIPTSTSTPTPTNPTSASTSIRAPVSSPSPTPIQLHPGKETYQVSQSKHDGPVISQVIFDPLDVQKGQKLVITTTVLGTPAATAVTGTLKTDHSQQEFTFTKMTAQDQWQTAVTLDDTVWYTYILTISAKNTSGVGTVIVAPRS